MKPEVDSNKWQNDFSYRFEKVDELMAYLDTFEDFSLKLKAYRELCVTLGGVYPLYGSMVIYQSEGNRNSYGDVVDEFGNQMPYKIFGLINKSREDIRILNKQVFEDTKQQFYKRTLDVPESKPKVIPFSALVKSYNERLSKTPIQIDFIKGELERIDLVISEFSSIEKKAVKIAYNDIMRIELIDWAKFDAITINQLNTALSYCWDIVEYQIFLKEKLLNVEESKIQSKSSPYFNIQKYNWTSDFEAKWKYITECIALYLNDDDEEYKGVIKELQYIFWEIESRSIALSMPGGRSRNAYADVDEKIIDLIEAQLYYYRYEVHKQPRLHKDPQTGREIYGMTDEQKKQHDKWYEPEKDSSGKIIEYTFDDWINDTFIYVRGCFDLPMLNDSERYLDLVSRGNMTYETLNRIQDAQAEIYDLLVARTLERLKEGLVKETLASLEPEKMLQFNIERVEEYLNQNKEVYYDVLRPKIHRQKKYGAKFITAKYYREKETRNQDVFQAFYPKNHLDVVRNQLYYDGNATRSQILYCQVEIQSKLLALLKSQKVTLNTSLESDVTTELPLFDQSTLNEIFWDDAVDKFKAIENQLIHEGYFTDSAQWQKRTKKVNLADLVKLIRLLQDYGYFRKKTLTGKILKPTDYRAFFERRYRCDISQQFSRYNFDLTNVKPLFPYIERIK